MESSYEDTDFLTVREVAKYLGASSATVYTLIAQGQLKAKDISASPVTKRPTYRIAFIELKNFLNKKLVVGSDTTPES